MEGRQAVAELLAAGRRRVRDVWVEDGVRTSPVLDRIVDLAAERRVPLRRVNRQALRARARTEAPQGVLARAQALPEADLDELCRGTGSRPPLLLALDGVTDPQNLGALLRTADGAGVTGVLLPRHRSATVTPAATKAAAGAVEWVPIAPVAGTPSALARAAELGLWVLGLDPTGPQSIFDLSLPDGGVVVALGAEGKGLSPLVRRRCDLLASIPVQGALASLNVAAAGAVALFEVARHRPQGPGLPGVR